jgi:hypothetical protein
MCSLRFSPEASAAEDAERRCLLRHHDRVVPSDRRRHVRHELELLGRLGDCAERDPGIGAVTLFLEPRVEVVTHDGERESGVVGRAGVLDETDGRRLLDHERVSDGERHGLRVPAGRRFQSR